MSSISQKKIFYIYSIKIIFMNSLKANSMGLCDNIDFQE